MNECCICLECIDQVILDYTIKNLKSNQGIKLPCNHIFHANCIRKAFLNNERCPLCRCEYTGIKQLIIPINTILDCFKLTNMNPMQEVSICVLDVAMAIYSLLLTR